MISENLENLYEKLEDKDQLVVVSKYRTVEEITEVYDSGHRVFGENRVQALLEREESLPEDIKWHMIGHLQRNKVKYIAPFIEMIHSVESEKLLKEINKEAKKNERIIPVLLQIHIAKEESKFGLSPQEVIELIESESLSEMENIKICGLMGMATNTTDKEAVKTEFRGLKNLFLELKSNYFKDNTEFKEISMGMSGDFQEALECGSTMIRVGSLVFNNH
jgi:pyridoxal phosphate enzyme (YggS family)